MSNNRQENYEKKREELEVQCAKCRTSTFMPTSERCDYGCTIGRKLRMLEAEYSDVTGWSHNKW